VGVPVDLPQSEGQAIGSQAEPLTITVDSNGRIFIHETEVGLEELEARLSAITAARSGQQEVIYIRGDRDTNYGALMRVMGRIASAGYRRISLVTELENRR
jgi:biopolymer transport protein TolR